MKLDVVLARQADGSIDCGIASAYMFLKYHNQHVSYEDVHKALSSQLDDLGLCAPRLGLYMMSRFGFDVDIVTLNPYILSVKQVGASQQDIYDRIKVRHDMLKEKHDKDIAQSFLDFMQANGRITPEIPTISHITKEIDAQRPVLASITSNFLFGNLRFNFHYNVVTGYDEKFIYVNDPSADETGGPQMHYIPNFLYAIHAAAYGDIDNGCLIRFKPKD